MSTHTVPIRTALPAEDRRAIEDVLAWNHEIRNRQAGVNLLVEQLLIRWLSEATGQTWSQIVPTNGSPMAINHQQLDEILADFSAVGRATYLDDRVLGLSHAAIDRDELGIPQFSPDLPQVPVALVERHQALWTHPDNDGPRQEVWTEHALSQGMQRLGHGVRKLPNLDGWLIAEWPRDGGGLQLQQPDGNLFVYALCDVTAEWIAAARHYGWVLVLHGPQLGLRVPTDLADAEHVRATELNSAHKNGQVTGGFMQWGQVRIR